MTCAMCVHLLHGIQGEGGQARLQVGRENRRWHTDEFCLGSARARARSSNSRYSAPCVREISCSSGSKPRCASGGGGLGEANPSNGEGGVRRSDGGVIRGVAVTRQSYTVCFRAAACDCRRASIRAASLTFRMPVRASERRDEREAKTEKDPKRVSDSRNAFGGPFRFWLFITFIPHRVGQCPQCSGRPGPSTRSRSGAMHDSVPLVSAPRARGMLMLSHSPRSLLYSVARVQVQTCRGADDCLNAPSAPTAR